MDINLRKIIAMFVWNVKENPATLQLEGADDILLDRGFQDS